MTPRFPGKKPGVGNDALSEFWERMRDAVLIAPFAWLLALILGGDPEDWDTLDEIEANLIPALMRLPIRILAELLGLIPIVGHTIEQTLTNYLAATANTASTAQSTASAAQSAATSAASTASSAYDLAVAAGTALDGITGYASRYMSSSPGVTTSASTMPFDTNVGGSVNVTWLSGGKARFDKSGVWNLFAQVRFWGAAFAPPRCYMDIVVRDSGGTIVTRVKGMASTDDEVTVTNVMTVEIPAAGYTAEVQAWTSSLPLIKSNWRGIGGGKETTRFTMLRVSPGGS